MAAFSAIEGRGVIFVLRSLLAEKPPERAGSKLPAFQRGTAAGIKASTCLGLFNIQTAGGKFHPVIPAALASMKPTRTGFAMIVQTGETGGGQLSEGAFSATAAHTFPAVLI